MKDNKEWLTESLLPIFNASLGSNLNYLHSTLTWTVSLLTAGLIVTFYSDGYPSHLSLIAINILLVLLCHFSVRTGNAFLNVIRYGALEKDIVRYKLSSDSDEDFKQLEQLKSKIIKYHCEWVSPLSRFDVMKKVLVELGFLYFILINVSLTAYTTYRLAFDSDSIIINLVTFIILLFEFFVCFVGSNYFKNIQVNDFARRIK